MTSLTDLRYDVFVTASTLNVLRVVTKNVSFIRYRDSHVKRFRAAKKYTEYARGQLWLNDLVFVFIDPSIYYNESNCNKLLHLPRTT